MWCYNRRWLNSCLVVNETIKEHRSIHGRLPKRATTKAFERIGEAIEHPLSKQTEMERFGGRHAASSLVSLLATGISWGASLEHVGHSNGSFEVYERMVHDELLIGAHHRL